MKKFLNIATFISVGLALLFVILLLHERNVFAFEYAHSGAGFMTWIMLAGAAVYPIFADRFTLSRNENLNNFLTVLLWGVMLVLAFLFAGYFSTEFNNPYL